MIPTIKHCEKEKQKEKKRKSNNKKRKKIKYNVQRPRISNANTIIFYPFSTTQLSIQKEMSFPNTAPQKLPKTFTGGKKVTTNTLSVPAKIGGMQLLQKSEASPTAVIRNPPVNYRTDFDEVNISLFSGAHTDNSQTRYTEGHLLFIKKSDRTIGANVDKAIYTLQNMNNHLEQSRQNFIASKVQIYQGAGKRKLREDDDGENTQNDMFPVRQKLDAFPITADAFSKVFSFVGIYYTSADLNKPSNSRRRQIGSRIAGTATTANIWGNVQHGDNVGLIVKFVDDSPKNFFDMDGQKIGTSNGGYLQVMPHVERNHVSPPHCTKPHDPQPTDRDYWDMSASFKQRIIDEKFLETKFKGGVKVRELNQEQLSQGTGGRYLKTEIQTEIYCHGHYIPIGVVKDTEGPYPSQNDIDLAIRSFPKWNELYRQSKVTIILRPNDTRQVNVL